LKKILILGSNHLICEIVRKAKEMGLFTVVVDWNPLERAPAKKIADAYYDVSLADTEKIVEIIKKDNIGGVITGFVDSYLPYYADICEKAGLPCYGTKEQFKILGDKKLYKELCRKFKVPTIDEYNVDKVFSDEKYREEIVYPVLVKPVDNSGARGVSVCANYDELVIGYEKALSFSPSKTVLIETFVKGREITTFYMFVDGEVYHIGHGNRLIGDKQKGVIGLPVGYSFPADNLPIYEKKILKNVKEMFKSIGLRNGMLFMQNLVKDNICYVYDIGYRLTGSLEYILTEEVAGFNALEYLINFATTGNMLQGAKDAKKLRADWGKYCFNLTVLVKPGEIYGVEGVEQVRNIKGVFRVVENHVPGETIPESSLGTLDQIVLRVFCAVNKPNDIYEIVEKIKASYKVYDRHKKSLLLPVFNLVEEGLYL